ncbi:hypothetical protein U9M48_005551, partial [Paspalum notatum var. saurae]
MPHTIPRFRRSRSTNSGDRRRRDPPPAAAHAVDPSDDHALHQRIPPATLEVRLPKTLTSASPLVGAPRLVRYWAPTRTTLKIVLKTGAVLSSVCLLSSSTQSRARGTYWIRSWSPLSNEEERGQLQRGCTKLKSVVLELFFNFGWPR